MSIAASVARGIALSIMLLLAPAGLLLVCYSETMQSGLLGAAALLVTASAGFAYAGRVMFAAGFSTAGIMTVAGLFFYAPDTHHGGPLQSSALPLTWSQVVPEIDQVKIGIMMAPALDRFIDSTQAKRIAQIVMPIYRGLKTESRRSALSLGYSALLGGTRGEHHMYWTKPSPKREDRMKPPALIFLHGAAGNFLAYPELLRRTNAVLVCPTQGFGLYRDEHANAESIDHAVRFATEHLGADPERVYLAALSQGGVSATQYAQARPDLAGLILISPVMDQRATQSWRGPRVLLIHGEQDRRIPKAYVQGTAAQLASSTATVSTRLFPGEDHFLLFSQPEQVLREIGEFMHYAATDEANAFQPEPD